MDKAESDGPRRSAHDRDSSATLDDADELFLSSHRQSSAALPSPFQHLFCALIEFEAFRNTQTFDPEDLAIGSCPDEQFMPDIARHLLVHEKILQFYRLGHADWLKTIARLPMAEDDRVADLVGVKQ